MRNKSTAKDYARFALQIILWPFSTISRINNSVSKDIFGERKIIAKSYIRQYFQAMIKKQESKKSVDDQMAFWGIIIHTASFMNSNKELSFEMKDKDSNSNYGNDASLFELCSFVLFTIDTWMSTHHYDDKKKTFLSRGIYEFMPMLVEALGVSGEEAVTLFNSRFRFYSDMLKEHKSINDMLEPLADFVVIAGQENKPFKGNNPPLSLSMDRIHVLLSLNVWCSAHLETLFGTLDKYLSDKK